MKTFLAAILVLAVAATAFGGGNPGAQAYISFDQTGAGAPIHGFTATPYVAFNAYFVLGNLDAGMRTVTLALSNPSVTCPGDFLQPGWTHLLPGPGAIGTWETGITISSFDCMPGPTVPVGYLTLFPLGANPCCLQILDHPEWPRWVIDCSDPGEVDYFCILSHGSISGGECPEGDCGSSSVEDATWGAIKAMHR